MNIFVPEITAKHTLNFAQPTVEPLDENGHVRRADVNSKRAQIVIEPDPRFLAGDHVNYRQVSSAGTWVGLLIVQDPAQRIQTPVGIIVGTSMTLRYSVDRPDGTPVGQSQISTYQVVE